MAAGKLFQISDMKMRRRKHAMGMKLKFPKKIRCPVSNLNQELVHCITDLEGLALGAFRTLSNDDAPGIVAACRQQFRQIGWAIFAIAIHDKDAVQILTACNVHQTYGDRPLVAKIEPKVKNLDAANHIGRQSERAELERL